MLPFQADVFPDKEHFGRIFFNMARMSRDGIPQISVVHGISVAGGAYAGAMGDLNIIVREQGFVGLAGVPLVKASLGEDVDAETLGGAVMHTSVSGVCDQLAESDAHALELTRAAIASLSYKPLLTPSMRAQPDRASEEPLYDPAELGGIVGTNVKQGYEVREVIARVVDGSRLDEWKKGYGETVVTGFGELHGKESHRGGCFGGMRADVLVVANCSPYPRLPGWGDRQPRHPVRHLGQEGGPFYPPVRAALDPTHLLDQHRWLYGRQVACPLRYELVRRGPPR